MNRRRKKEKEKKKIHLYSGHFHPKKGHNFLKNFFEILCPLFRFSPHYISERQNSSAQNGTSKQKGVEQTAS